MALKLKLMCFVIHVDVMGTPLQKKKKKTQFLEAYFLKDDFQREQRRPERINKNMIYQEVLLLQWVSELQLLAGAAYSEDV